MQHLPICVIQYIFDMLSLKNQINFSSCAKRYRYNLFIKQLHTARFISNETIYLHIFKKLESFKYLDGNIQNLSHLKHLKSLCLDEISIHNLDYYGLINLNIQKLKLRGYDGVLFLKKLPFLKKLTIIDYLTSLSFLKHFNLSELCLTDGFKSEEPCISHMSNLRKLRFHGNIYQSELQNLKLVKLDLLSCNTLRSLSFISTLQKLVLIDTSVSCLKGLNLISLTLHNNPIQDISYLTQLQSLKISGECHLLEYLIPTHNLKYLNLDKSTFKNILKHTTKLESLVIRGMYNWFKNSDLKGLNLTYLDVSYNPYITNISHLTSLQKLKCQGTSAINPQSIKGLNIKKISYRYNCLF